MAVKRSGVVSSRNLSAEENMIQDLIEISRTLEKYRNIRALDAAVYIIDGYLEDLEEMEE